MENQIELQGENEELEPIEPEAPASEPDDDDEIPEELLSQEERDQRARAKEREAAEANETRERDRDERLVRVVSEAFGRTAAPVTERHEERAAPPQPKRMSPEERAALNQKILEEPDGIVKAIEWARNQGRSDALNEFGRTTGPAASLLGESAVERFMARKLRDEPLGKAIEPFFDELIKEYDTATLATMPPAERQRTLDDLYDVAAGRMVRKKGSIKRAVSPGAGRGAGGSGSQQRRTRTYKMTDKEKQSIYDSLPNTEEGRARARKQIAQIEFGVMDDATARAVADSVRFAESVRGAV